MSRVNKNRIIFEQLSIAEPGAVEKFCDILKKKKRQMFIAEQLAKCECEAIKYSLIYSTTGLHSTTSNSTSEPATVVQACVFGVERFKSRYLRLQPIAKTDWAKHQVTEYVRLALVKKENVTLRDENLNEVTKLTLRGDVDRILKKKE